MIAVAAGRLLAVVLLTFSGMAAGGSVALLFAPRDSWLKGHDRTDRIALDSARLGFAIMVALISEAVYRAGRVDAGDWRIYVYLLGSAMAGIGYFTLAVRGILRRRKAKQEAT